MTAIIFEKGKRPMTERNRLGLSGNALKLIAVVSMFIDHAGVVLFPHVVLLRVIGRLAFPIFAFMLAEGCEKTRNKPRHFLSVFVLGCVCQLVYYLYDGDTYMNILITLSLSILLVYALQYAKAALFGGCRWGKKVFAAAVFLLAVAAVWLLNRYVRIDYGFWGCMLPVTASLLRPAANGAPAALARLDTLTVRVAAFTVGLVVLAIAAGGVQIYSLCAVPLLLLYSGQRGKGRMKWFFYVFYPTHLAALELISLVWRG